MIFIKTPQQIEKIRESGRLASRALDLVADHIKPGVTTESLDAMIHEFIVKNGAIPATLGYRGSSGASPYPASCCISINEVICHGIPGPRKLLDGDLVTIDVTTILNGFYGDTARTFLVGNASETAKRLTAVTEESLKRAIAVVKSGIRLGDIGHAIQSYVEAEGFSVVRHYVGHGVGIKFHEEPSVLHYGKKGKGLRIQTGMVFTIEPMINEGVYDLEILDDGWTAVTADGKLSAQFEHTMAVTDKGVDVLTLS
ncbi:MAG: type I methionyl aminopeptidase [Deltaproteobacteria bacterium]|jgi:methionyl aminopeptidase|nr:type I methionyl aminopeptidase [Deltaproteobacteria bacterium]